MMWSTNSITVGCGRPDIIWIKGGETDSIDLWRAAVVELLREVPREDEAVQ